MVQNRRHQGMFQSPGMNKQAVIAVIRRELKAVISERNATARDADALAARLALRRFQSQRMASSHADLLDDPEYHAAAQFFLSDLYGTEDLTERDANLMRVIPSMEKLLPAAALETVAKAIALDALSEKLDAAMAARLGQDFSEKEYVAAYRTVMARTDRERQLSHVESVGYALCDLVRVPLIGSTLSMMRGPAKLANLGELHSFLERGFRAFKAMRNPRHFVETVVSQERAIMEDVYAGKPSPFRTVA